MFRNVHTFIDKAEMAGNVTGKANYQTIEVDKCVDVTIGPTDNGGRGLLIESKDPVKMTWNKAGIRLEALYKMDADGWKSCKSNRGEYKVRQDYTGTTSIITTGSSFASSTIFSLSLPQFRKDGTTNVGADGNSNYRRSWTVDSTGEDKIRTVYTDFSDVRFKSGTPFAKNTTFQLVGNSHVNLDWQTKDPKTFESIDKSKDDTHQFDSVIVQTTDKSELNLGGAKVDSMVGLVGGKSRLYNFFVKTSAVFRAEGGGIIHGQSSKQAAIVQTANDNSKITVGPDVKNRAGTIGYLWECFGIE